MADHVVAVDVIVLEPPAVIDVASVGVQGPPGAPGPAGPAGVPGPPGPGGTGDVTGPASATADALAVFSGTTGKLVKDAVGAAAFGTINSLIAGAVTTGTVSVGANPAQIGGIRLANGIPGLIKARNNANTADLDVALVYSDNKVYLGAEVGDQGLVLRSGVSITADKQINAPSIAIGANPAQSGAVRLAAGDAIRARNTPNTGDTHLVSSAGSQTYFAYSDDAVHIGAGGNPSISLESNLVTAQSAVAIGTNPAQSGALRLANSTAITVRNSGNGGDFDLIKSSGDQVEVGTPGLTTYFHGLVRCGEILKLYNPAVLQLGERPTAPAAPPANTANLYLTDNGSGKSQLMIQFATGASVQLAIEP